MFRHMIVPTDGSPLSEAAFPLAQLLALAQGSTVTVAHVVEPPTLWATDAGTAAYFAGGDDVVRRTVETLERAGREHLDRVAERFRAAGIEVNTLLQRGSPAAELLACAVATSADLIVMSSHGRSAVARLALGSVTDRLVREANVPVVTVRAFSPRVERLSTAVVPLDGSELAEQALPVAEELAGKPLQRVVLVRATESTDERDATLYLRRIAARLVSAGLEVDVTLPRGHPAEAIIEAARGVDMVLMATHGRSGLDHLRRGSVAEQCLRELDVPLLRVRPRQFEARTGEFSF